MLRSLSSSSLCSQNWPVAPFSEMRQRRMATARWGLAEAARADQKDALAAGLKRIGEGEAAGHQSGLGEGGVGGGVGGLVVGERAVEVAAGNAGLGEGAFGAEGLAAGALAGEADAAVVGRDQEAGVVAKGGRGSSWLSATGGRPRALPHEVTRPVSQGWGVDAVDRGGGWRR